MIRWAAALGVVAVLGFGTAALSAPHHPAKRCHRRHHHRVCTRRHKPNPPVSTTNPTTTSTTATGPLPSRLEVDENDQGQPPQPYSLWPSHNPVASGKVQFNVYNFGQDPHTFAIVDSGGHQLAFARAPANQPQTAVAVSANLAPGTYRLECTLPGHATLGMAATLTVK